MAKRPFALSVVVPVYNGASSIAELVSELSRLRVEGGLEIVLVNDASRDDSVAVCRELVRTAGVPVTLVDLSRNFGEHNAVMCGLAHARGDYVITMDDDLQNPPEEVVRLFEHTRDGGFDVVYTYYERKEHAAWRNWGSAFTNWCADRLLDKPPGLYLSSFRCMSAFVCERLSLYSGPYPYVDGLIFQITHNVGRLQVRHLPRAAGRTNYTLRRLVRLWLSMFLNFSVMPLRLSTLTGLAIGALGVLGILFVLIEAIFFGRAVAGWASLMVTVLILSGVQLVILGVIGEYLGRMFLATNQKPQYMVRTVWRRDAEGRLTDEEPRAGTAAASRPYAVADRIVHSQPRPAVDAARDSDGVVIALPKDESRRLG